MDYLDFSNQQIPYKIIRSSRKTISIRVNHEGVTMRAPRQISKQALMELLHMKEKWIVSKYSEISKMTSAMEREKYLAGDHLFYRGNEYELEFCDTNDCEVQNAYNPIWIQGSKIMIASNDHSKGKIQRYLEVWYRQQARQRIMERVEFFTMRYDFGKKVNRIVVKDQKSRWGSCSSKCNLNFNYRLIMAPDEVLDYVVVHELCHLKHMNHSEQFWCAVFEILPDYLKQKEWLKIYGRTLVF